MAKSTRSDTWSICPGCVKQIGGEDAADGQYRLLKHIGDMSANEHIERVDNPKHVGKLFWKQLCAIEKVKSKSEDKRPSSGRASSSNAKRDEEWEQEHYG